MLTYEVANDLLRYEPETGDLYWKKDVARNVKAGTIAGISRVRDLYKILTINKRQYQAHRIVWLLTHKQHPKEFVDHIDGDKTNNKLPNLREANRSLNAQNQRKPSKRNATGYLGVSFKKKGYEASIRCNNKSIYLGRFKDPEIAHQKYLQAKRELHAGCTI